MISRDRPSEHRLTLISGVANSKVLCIIMRTEGRPKLIRPHSFSTFPNAQDAKMLCLL